MFRILSLDGGGMRGIVPAHILKIVERSLGGHLRDHFDLIAGTSTGAIIAGAIAAGLSADELFNIYDTQGHEIFPYRKYVSPQRVPLFLKYGLSAPKFSDRGLTKVITEHLGNLTLGAITPSSPQGLHLLLTSYDTVRRTPVIFKSWRHHKWYKNLPLADACISSASAPTFFPAHRIDPHAYGLSEEYSLIDGGVCANNPTSCAVVAATNLLAEAFPSQSLEMRLRQIKVLSIGTGDPAQSFPWARVKGWGLSQWAPRIADVFMDAPNDIHRYIAEKLMPVPSNYLRLQFSVNDQLVDKLLESNSPSMTHPRQGCNLRAIDDARPLFRQRLVAATELYLDGQLDEALDMTHNQRADLSPRQQLEDLLLQW